MRHLLLNINLFIFHGVEGYCVGRPREIPQFTVPFKTRV